MIAQIRLMILEKIYKKEDRFSLSCPLKQV